MVGGARGVQLARARVEEEARSAGERRHRRLRLDFARRLLPPRLTAVIREGAGAGAWACGMFGASCCLRAGHVAGRLPTPFMCAPTGLFAMTLRQCGHLWMLVGGGRVMVWAKRLSRSAAECAFMCSASCLEVSYDMTHSGHFLPLVADGACAVGCCAGGCVGDGDGEGEDRLLWAACFLQREYFPSFFFYDGLVRRRRRGRRIRLPRR